MGDVEREVFDLVYNLGQEQLEEVCDHLKIPLTEGKTNPYLRRKIIRKLSTLDLEGDEEDDQEQVLVGWFEELRQFILNLSTLHQKPFVKSELGAYCKSWDKGPGDEVEEEDDPEIRKVRKMFMKELKISGRIGDLANKDCISYTSLCYQIRSAKGQGYSDKEIIGAVIKAINPSLELRTYLEGRTNLTFESLMKTLRAHYKEQDATSLFIYHSSARP